MRKKIAFFLFLAMLISSLAACTSSSTDSSSAGSSSTDDESSSSDSGSEETARTDMTSRIWTEVTTLDPTMSADASTELAIIYQIYDSFFEPVDGDYNNLKGALVEDEYYVNEDATYYEFTVKSGILWHNGDTLDVEDCIFSVERMMASSVTSARISAITSVEQTGDMTFAITCEYSMPRLPALFSTASMSVVNKDLIEEYGDNAIETVVGTGAYQLESWESDELVLTAFEDGWRGTPEIETITYALITDTNAAKIAFDNGEVDQYYVASQEELEEYQDETEYFVNPYTTGTIDSLVFNTSRTDSWVSNETFRLAVAYAIDREALNEIATDGLYQVVDSMFPEGNGAYDEDWVYPYSYDPDKAMELLEECGYDGAAVELVYCSAYAIPTAWATTIEAYLRAVGINVTMTGMDYAGVLQNFVDRDYDMACLEYGPSYPDPLSSIYALFRSDGYYNAWCYYSDEVDATVLSLYGISDSDEQAEAMQELDQWALESVFYIPCYQVGGYAVYPATLRTTTVSEPMFGWSRICYSYWITESELAEELSES